MAEESSLPRYRFLPTLAKAYALGTIVSAVVLHVATSLIAPGDGGTLLALGTGAIQFAILIMVGLIGLVVFPMAAAASWPFRGLVVDYPLVALAFSAGVGTLIGGVLTATEFQIGPGDFWSGPLVGLIYGAVWFWVVRKSAEQESGGAQA